MKSFKPSTSFLAGLFILLPLAFARGQTPAPAPLSAFTIPLSDKTMAQAQFLPAPDGDTWLIYSTPTGQIGLWSMSPATNPQPTPSPDPTPEPTPTPTPIPTHLTLWIVGDDAPINPSKPLADWLTSHNVSSRAVAVAQVADPTTDPQDLAIIALSAGQSYPYAACTDQDQRILWHAPLPDRATEVEAILSNLLNPSQHKGRCLGGNCPLP